MGIAHISIGRRRPFETKDYSIVYNRLLSFFSQIVAMASPSPSESYGSGAIAMSKHDGDLTKVPGVVDHQDSSIKEGMVNDQAALDDAILRAQGHDAAMPRSFSIMSALGLGFSITNSWVGYAVSTARCRRPWHNRHLC